MNEQMKIEVQAYQIVEKKVKASGNSGRVYVPKEWVGKKVKVFLLEPVTEEETTSSRRKRGEGV
jgi:putative transposon-encoded protein